MEMKQVKTSELIDPALEWAAAVLETSDKGGLGRVQIVQGQVFIAPSSRFHTPRWARYSTDWAKGGPIVERERLLIEPQIGKEVVGNAWAAITISGTVGYGPTPLIAAMRCYVASKLGDVVEVPIELL